MATMCKKICKECPFHKGSIGTWLGHHTVDEILAHKNLDLAFTCHMQRGDDESKNTKDFIDVCRGYVIWATKQAHMFKEPELYALQQEVKQNMDEWDNVLNMVEFFDHHGYPKSVKI